MSNFETGTVIGVGASHMRQAMVDKSGEPGRITKFGTPATHEQFVTAAASHFVQAYTEGAIWGVMGVPGPTSVTIDRNNHVSQQMRVTNIEALRDDFDPVEEMSSVNSDFAAILAEGKFTYLTVNDGDLAAQAAASFYADSNKKSYNRVAALIDGTGIGGAIVDRDEDFPDLQLFHPDRGLWEVGHNPTDMTYFSNTVETLVSGTALKKRTGIDAENIARTHAIWQEVAQGLGSQVLNLGINGGAELVVISGSNGIHGYYRRELTRILKTFKQSANPMTDTLPDVQIVPRTPRSLTDRYELYGAQGAMRSFLVRKAIREAARTQNIAATALAIGQPDRAA